MCQQCADLSGRVDHLRSRQVTLEEKCEEWADHLWELNERVNALEEKLSEIEGES